MSSAPGFALVAAENPHFWARLHYIILSESWMMWEGRPWLTDWLLHILYSRAERFSVMFCKKTGICLCIECMYQISSRVNNIVPEQKRVHWRRIRESNHEWELLCIHILRNAFAFYLLFAPPCLYLANFCVRLSLNWQDAQGQWQKWRKSTSSSQNSQELFFSTEKWEKGTGRRVPKSRKFLWHNFIFIPYYPPLSSQKMAGLVGH